MGKYTVVRLDDMDTTIRSAVYVESNTPKDVENGTLVTLTKPYKNGVDRELFQAEKPTDVAKDTLFLVASVEDDAEAMLTGFAFDKFINKANGRPIRVFALEKEKIFSVSKEGFDKTTLAEVKQGGYVVADTTGKLKAVSVKPQATTNKFIGEIIRVDKPNAEYPVELAVIRILNA